MSAPGGSQEFLAFVDHDIHSNILLNAFVPAHFVSTKSLFPGSDTVTSLLTAPFEDCYLKAVKDSMYKVQNRACGYSHCSDIKQLFIYNNFWNGAVERYLNSIV